MSQTFFSKPPGGLYSLPYLSEGMEAESPALSRAEWWEILFFIKKLDAKQQQEVNGSLLQSLDLQVRTRRGEQSMMGNWADQAQPPVRRSVPQEVELEDSSLIGLSIPVGVAKKLLHYLKHRLPSSCLGDLLCSHTFSKHYLKRGGGGGGLEDEELLGEDSATCCLWPPLQVV